MLKSQKAPATITNRARRLETAMITFMVTLRVKMTFTNFTPHSVGNPNKVKTARDQILTLIAIFMEQNRVLRTLKVVNNKEQVKAANIRRRITTNETRIQVLTRSSSMSRKRLVAGVRQSKSTTKGCLGDTKLRVLNQSLIGTNSRIIGVKYRLMLKGGLNERQNIRSTSQASKVTSTKTKEDTLRRTLINLGTRFFGILKLKCSTSRTLASLENRIRKMKIMRARKGFLTVKHMSR